MQTFMIDAFKNYLHGRMVLLTVLISAVVMIFYSEGTYQQSVKKLDGLVAVIGSRAKILELTKNLLDVETGQRDYLLTGREEYLAPYYQALGPIRELFEGLAVQYSEQDAINPLILKLQERVVTRLSVIEATLRLKQLGQLDVATKLALTGSGKEQVDEIYLLSKALLEHGTISVTESRQDIDDALLLQRGGVMALTALSTLGLLLYMRHMAVVDQLQREHNRILQAERDQLEDLVSKRTHALTGLAQHLQTAREDERGKLARNLHDELGALLTAAKLDAARLKPRLVGAAPDAHERLDHLVQSLNACIAMGRGIIEDLRPSTLSNLGLVAALEILAREFTQNTGVAVRCALTSVRLAASAELVVYRLVQEAITNITKYAKAQQVWVELAAQDGLVRVTVRDDGLGFDTGTQPASAYGLVGMHYRIEAERGQLCVLSAPGKGTNIQAFLPESESA
jgi:signal transduction histidine kinase